MNNSHAKRDCSLPPGCKDLIDTLLPPVQNAIREDHEASPLPPFLGEVVLSDQTSVRSLAALLDVKPFRLIADLIDLGVMATVDQPLDLVTLSRIARKHGYLAVKRPNTQHPKECRVFESRRRVSVGRMEVG